MTPTEVIVAAIIVVIAALTMYHFWPEKKAAYTPSNQQPEIIYPEWTGEDYKG